MALTIRQGAKAGKDAKVFETKFALNWTGPYKILAVDPCPSSDTPDGSPLGGKLFYLDLPTDMPGADAHRRVSVERCEPCTNPHDRGDMPKYLPEYVLENFTKKIPRYHVTQDGVSAPLQRLEVERISGMAINGHQSLRGRGGGGVIAVM